MNSKETQIEEILKNNNVGEMLLGKLKTYIDETSFKEALDQHVKTNLTNKELKDISAHEIFNLIHSFVNENLPVEVQEKLFYDVRQYLDENIKDFVGIDGKEYE